MPSIEPSPRLHPPSPDRPLTLGEALEKLFMDNADRGANAANDALIEELQQRIRALRKTRKAPVGRWSSAAPVKLLAADRHQSVLSDPETGHAHREDGMNDEEEGQMSVLIAPGDPSGFADDPIASHSAQFGLGRPMGMQAGHDAPSPAGVRPWNLRGARVMDGGARLGAWRYDHDRQVAVTWDGRLVTEVVAADPSADSTTDLDGDEGKSEDWTYDFCPDESGDQV